VAEMELPPVGRGQQLPHGVGRAPWRLALVFEGSTVGRVIEAVRGVPSRRGLEDPAGGQLLGLEISEDEAAGRVPDLGGARWIDEITIMSGSQSSGGGM
jgi:hypothetical protein